MILRCQHMLRPIVSLVRPMRTVTTDAPSNPMLSSFLGPSPTPPTSSSPPTPIPNHQERRPSTFIPPDNDPLLAYFTSLIQHHGEKQKAQRLTTKILQNIHLLTRSLPLPIFRQAIFSASPSVRIVTYRQGPRKILTPFPLGDKARARWAIKWILKKSAGRSDRTLDMRVAKELIAIIQGESPVLKEKEIVHRIAVANRSNALVRR